MCARALLQVMNLSQNKLDGCLPSVEGPNGHEGGSLSGLTRLRSLSLRHNLLTVHS